ncbi:hypothetical protein V6N11_063513 [Hibiscus sabdariffa]
MLCTAFNSTRPSLGKLLISLYIDVDWLRSGLRHSTNQRQSSIAHASMLFQLAKPKSFSLAKANQVDGSIVVLLTPSDLGRESWSRGQREIHV